MVGSERNLLAGGRRDGVPITIECLLERAIDGRWNRQLLRGGACVVTFGLDGLLKITEQNGSKSRCLCGGGPDANPTDTALLGGDKRSCVNGRAVVDDLECCLLAVANREKKQAADQREVAEAQMIKVRRATVLPGITQFEVVFALFREQVG